MGVILLAMHKKGTDPARDKHFDTREIVLILYASGGFFWIILLGLIGLPVLGISLNSLALTICLPLLHLVLCISVIVWAFRDFKKNKP